jgi:hypothetical protein
VSLDALKRWWVAPAVALAVVVGMAVGWNRDRQSISELKRQAEFANLKAEGFAVAVQASARDLAAKAAELTALTAEVERLKHASPGVKPVEVWHGSTGPVVAGPVPASPPTVQPAPGAPADVGRLLSVGDKGEIRVAGSEWQTVAGNRVLVVAAEAWRLEPAPAVRLFGGPLRLDVSVAAPARPMGWGVGLMASAGRAGWMVGPALSPPPWKFWGLEVEGMAGATVGPSGEWAATGAALVRW